MILVSRSFGGGFLLFFGVVGSMARRVSDALVCAVPKFAKSSDRAAERFSFPREWRHSNQR